MINKIIKKKMALLLTVIMLFSSVMYSPSFAGTLNKDGVSGKVVTQQIYGRTFISSESLKSYSLKTVITGNNIKISNNSVTFEFTNGSNSVKVNDAKMTIDGEAYIKNNVAYVPLKFIFETLNYTVGYSYSTKEITLKYNGNFVFPITIHDDTASYRFTKPAKRIVSLAPSITEILFAIGAGDMVVGRTKYCNYPEETSKVTVVGTLYEPDLETIIDLEPDTVIAATHMNEDVMTALSKAKISTLTQASPAKINEIYILIEQLGKLTNHTYESRAVISSMKAKEDRVNNIMKQIPTVERKKIYYVVGTGKSEFTAGKQTFIHEILVSAGCVNVATDVDKWSYTLEKLIEKNPDYLIGADYSYKTMKESNNYSSLSAINKNQFVVVNTDVFSIPGPRVMDYSMKTIIEKLYPQFKHQLRF